MRLHRRSTRLVRFLLCAGFCLAGAGAKVADAQIDANGPWFVRFDISGVMGNRVEQWTQAGTSLTSQIDPFCTYTGTIDPLTGAFAQTGCGTAGELCAADAESRSGTVAADGRTFEASGETCIEINHMLCFCTPTTYLGSRCGNAVLDAGEECDDGNRNDSDGCNANCEIEECYGCSGEPSDCDPLPATSCDDGSPCTEDTCQPGVGCVHQAPAQTCNEASRSQLLVKDRDNDAKDVVLFKWLRGLATPADVGDPTSLSDYRICLYAGSGAAQVISEATVPASIARWRGLGDSRFRYKDSLGGEEGIQKISLEAGANDGKIVVKGLGQSLAEPHPPLSLPVAVRVTNEETGACWGTIFDQDDVKRNEEGKFKAKARTP